MKESPRPQSQAQVFSLSVFASIALIIVLGLVLYANVIGYPFVHDDIVFILQNPNIARWDNLADAFLNPSIPISFKDLVTPYYRPVLEVFYRLLYLLFGFHPAGFHLFNVIVHAANGVLVFEMFRKILRKPTVALVGALVFVVHPVQTEAVACVAGISNVLCAFFILLSLFFYQRIGYDHQRKFRWFSLALISFVTALFTKEQAVFALALFGGYEWFLAPRTSQEGKARWVRLSVLAVAAVGYLSLRHLLFGSVSGAVFENMAELKLRLLTIARTIDMLIGLVLAPFDLHYYRSVDFLAPLFGPWVIFLLLIVLTVWQVTSLPKELRKIAWFGIFWFVVMAFPLLNVIPLVNEYSFLAVSEHGLYLPLIGLILTSGVIIRTRWNHVIQEDPRLTRWILIGLILLLSLFTVRQNTFWRGEIPLFERALTYEPQLGRVHVLLAKAYMFNNRISDALSEFQKAQEIMSAYARKATTPKARHFYEGFLKGIYSDAAQCYFASGQAEAALERYNRAIVLDPNDGALYGNRAMVFLQRGQLSEGMRDLETALRLNPNNLSAANNLGIGYIQSGEPERARAIFMQIIRRDPSFVPARDNLQKLNSRQ